MSLLTAKGQSELDRLMKSMDGLFKQSIYATSQALNETAKDVKKGVERQLNKDIDRPTKFTQSAFKINHSNKKTLKASVEIKPIQAKYLKYQIEGGTRRAKTIIIPRKKAQNKYGNLPRGKLNRLSQAGKSYKAGGLVVQVLKTKEKPLAYMSSKGTAKYKKLFKFYERGRKVAQKVFGKHFSEQLVKAISTAR